MTDKETLYARWLSGEVTEDELEALKNDGAIHDLEQILKTADQWRLPAYDRSEGLKKIKAKRQAKKSKVKRIYLPWIGGIAASFLVIFTLFNYFDSAGMEYVVAGNGSNQKVDLVDGSSVVINDGSSITYDSKNWSEDRSIKLVGEAYFEVEKGSRFVVNTKNGSIEVLGTKFNVRAWGDRLSVECYEGSVKVSAQNAESILSKNEAIQVVNNQMEDKGTISDTIPSWSSGQSRFSDEDIREVFSEVERQYDVIIKAPSLNQTFSGIFPHDDLENALQRICLPLGLKYEISANKKEVVIEK